MTKAIKMLLVVILVLGVCLPVFAADSKAPKNWGDKLVRGGVNIITSPAEIPVTIGEECQASKNIGIGLFAGTLKGLCFFVGRAVSGFWDVLTFPVAIPKNYEPLVKPDYVSDKLIKSTSTPGQTGF